MSINNTTTRGGVEDTRLVAKAKDTKKIRGQGSLSEDRHSRGQGQESEVESSRTHFQVLVLGLEPCVLDSTSDRNTRGRHKRKCSPKKKRSSQKFFRRSPQKNVFQKIVQALHKILTIQKLVLSSSRGQANFRGLEAKDLTFEANAKDFRMCPRGLHL